MPPCTDCNTTPASPDTSKKQAEHICICSFLCSTLCSACALRDPALWLDILALFLLKCQRSLFLCRGQITGAASGVAAAAGKDLHLHADHRPASRHGNPGGQLPRAGRVFRQRAASCLCCRPSWEVRYRLPFSKLILGKKIPLLWYTCGVQVIHNSPKRSSWCIPLRIDKPQALEKHMQPCCSFGQPMRALLAPLI